MERGCYFKLINTFSFFPPSPLLSHRSSAWDHCSFLCSFMNSVLSLSLTYVCQGEKKRGGVEEDERRYGSKRGPCWEGESG